MVVEELLSAKNGKISKSFSFGLKTVDSKTDFKSTESITMVLTPQTTADGLILRITTAIAGTINSTWGKLPKSDAFWLMVSAVPA